MPNISGKAPPNPNPSKLSPGAELRHLKILGIAGAFAIADTMLLMNSGAHDIGGVLAVMAGYPGFMCASHFNPDNLSPVLLTAVNWLTYFLVLEVILALKRWLTPNKPSPPSMERPTS
jgi:hypothetical protein